MKDFDKNVVRICLAVLVIFILVGNSSVGQAILCSTFILITLSYISWNLLARQTVFSLTIALLLCGMIFYVLHVVSIETNNSLYFNLPLLAFVVSAISGFMYRNVLKKKQD